jgi:pSer/pThr/pTyr-binding forkhead associated (FHA) protein
LYLEDLGSTNGTFLNGKQVSDSARLKKGDQVQVGQTILRAERT